MRSTTAAAVLSAVLGLTAPGAVATAQTAGREAPRTAWPKELVSRGTTLPRGMVEVTLPLGFSLSSDRVAKPAFLAPGVSFGVTDDLTVGLRHFLGLCFTGSDNGCPQPYNDLSVDAMWRLVRAGGAELAFGAAVDAAPIDPFTLSIEARMRARWAGGPFALVLAPSLDFGLTDRSSRTVGKRVPISLPLATYSFGWFQDVTENREILTIPATIQVQVIPSFAAAVGAALIAPLDPIAGEASDYLTFPFGAALLVTPTGAMDVGASFTFRNLLGREKWPATRPGESRLLQVFVTLRR